ncbi:MAG: substrate-binding domain-containing protein [Piscinibacter sp.]|nr:substrate-binding domain-containing protein [Piscinibacter sp.]
MLHRRHLLLAGCAAAAGPGWAQQRRSLKDPLRLGVDDALVESGLAPALQKAFGRDTGVAVQLVPGPALPTLDALERGELDAALTNAPEAEARLEQKGLAHDRRPVATGGFVIVGPAPTPKSFDPAGIARMSDATEALVRVRDAALGAPGTVLFLSAGDGSGTHAAEQALWRAARVAPAAPWYQAAAKGSPLLTQARSLPAYALVDRAVWARHGGKPLAVLVEGDPRLSVPVHVMRSFRVNHPAGKIFTGWITGPKGRRVVAGLRGYSVPA